MTVAYPLALLGLLALPYFLWLGRPRGVWTRGRAIAALALRGLIVLALVLSLAGLHMIRASDSLAVVFLIDASDSMPPAAVEEARLYAEEAIQAMRQQDQAAIIVFGTDALVERPMSPVREVGPLESEVLPLNTDLAEAIRLGLALYPPGAARRMVILSDGLANVGSAEQAAQLAAASGVEIVAVPYATVLGAEVLVTDVDVPTRLNEGQVFDLTVTVESSIETTALLRVIGGGEVAVEETVALVEGVNRYAFTLTATETGLTSYRVQLVPAGEDVFYQNNQLSAFTQVVGPPRVLVVAVDEAESANLEQALIAQGIMLDHVEAAALPADLATLSAYQSIVLVNVPARELGPRKMELLAAYVRDLGGGLVVVGGPNSYGPGGYFMTPLEEILPVEMQLRDQERLPQLAVVYVIDKSGSMSDFSPGGFSKIELAKEAIIRSVQLLGPLDRVGVVAFDENASWLVPIQEASDRGQIANLVGGLRAGGGTDIYAGLLAVSQVFPDDPSQVKHVILLSDGGASDVGIADLVTRMYEEAGITLSVVAITAPGEQYGQFIEDLPALADGRFHHAYSADTIPEIFTEETIIATRAYIIEHEFFPSLTSSSPVLTGIGGTPSLLGYVGTTIKPTGQQILATDEDDPLLATWQYGLGRTLAWTSDASGRWAGNWAAWVDFARFWSQAVRWTITEGINQNVEVRVVQEGERVRLVVDALADDGSYLNGLQMEASIVSPDLSSEPLALQQVAPGRYEATFEPDEEGAYFVRVAGVNPGAAGDAPVSVAQTSGWVLAYSPEYRSFEGDPAYLEYITGLTGGRLVEEPAEVFAHNLGSDRALQPVWPGLVLLAAVLLPFDIAVRRLVISRADWARLAAWLGFGRRRKAVPVETGASRVGALLDVKERISRQQPETAAPPPLAAIGRTEEAETGAAPAAEAPRRAAPTARTAQGSGTVSSLLKSKRERGKEE
jgi:Mg-chelatase subunit ChlD